MKKRIFVLNLLIIAFVMSSCAKEESYVSKRHPENPQATSESVEKNHKSSNGIFVEINKSNDKSTEDSYTTEREMENGEDLVGSYANVVDITNLRSEASTDSDIVLQLTPEDQVYVNSVEDGWAMVSYDDYEGYILAELLEPSEQY
ncbi:MAG: SH3 domain-containing protein [Tissierellia bacterium]|nr:SH3 domain-containing protein [Tissierellia bacterium]